MEEKAQHHVVDVSTVLVRVICPECGEKWSSTGAYPRVFGPKRIKALEEGLEAKKDPENFVIILRFKDEVCTTCNPNQDPDYQLGIMHKSYLKLPAKV